MSNVISPQLAASLASAIYDIQSDRFSAATIDRFKGSWDLNCVGAGGVGATDKNSKIGNAISGRSGTLFVIKKKTGFCVVAEGVGAEFEGDLLILFRGTDNAFDWASDATVGFSYSSATEKVHTGFNKCFKSILPELQARLLSYKKTVRTIHCIGHSLGGALASLAAEWIKESGVIASTGIKLYSFGSPRVGCEGFVKNLTAELSGGVDIYRVFHKTDVVPMVPVWPFYHLPLGERSYCLNSPGNLPSGEYHKMTQYIPSVSKTKGWDGMVDFEPPVQDSAIERWLSSDGPVSLTINTMSFIGSAIAYVVKKILHCTGIAVQFGLATGVTLLDQLAYVLAKGYDLSKVVSKWVYALIKKIMLALGMKVAKDISITAQFIKLIFSKLMVRINRLVDTAVKLAFAR